MNNLFDTPVETWVVKINNGNGRDSVWEVVYPYFVSYEAAICYIKAWAANKNINIEPESEYEKKPLRFAFVGSYASQYLAAFILHRVPYISEPSFPLTLDAE